MTKYVRELTPKVILLLIITLLLPQLVAADSRLQDLQKRNDELESRIENLNSILKQEEEAIVELGDRGEQLRRNILEIKKQMTENERRIIALNQVLAERDASLAQLKNSLSAMLRDLESKERASAVAVFFNNDNFADALRDLDHREFVTKTIAEKYNLLVAESKSIKEARAQLEMVKLSLASARVSLDLQQRALLAEQTRRQVVIDQSSALLRIAEAEHVDVKRELYASAFDSTARAITLEEAAFYADLAVRRLKEATGQDLSVPLLLALVKQESNFGNYLGKGHYKSAMCSQRQIEAFLQITRELNLDPDLTPVSKPAENQSCGGAMGYAQFLPTTWLGYAAEVAKLTGNNPPSPWNPEDAFMAAALKLATNGAARGQTPQEKRQAQWEAVMTYFAGSKWKDPEVAKEISWYGYNVLAMADSFEALISG